MRLPILASTAALALLAAGPAMAQQQPPPEQKPQAVQLPPDADSLLDKKAVGQDGKELGAVKDVVVTPDGKVAAVVIEGDKTVAITWDQLKISGDQLSLNMNEDQLSQMPEYTGTDK